MIMTFGTKLSKLRKDHNYTQEQLAGILGVSRQSISKWESDVAYPETEKLIKLGKLFGCSMDYLLNEDVTDMSSANAVTSATILDKFHKAVKMQCRERISEKTIMGMPLYHVGRNAKGFFAIGLKASGVFAIGLRSKGVVSLGLLSFGILSMGLLSIGLLSLGTLALGIVSIGSISLGLLAIGAIAIGIVSVGAISIGCFSSGALAIGHYAAVGDKASGMIALGKSTIFAGQWGEQGPLEEANWSEFYTRLEQYTPKWLSWAKNIFKLLICR
jgi:transcriptional regulator with XRE-family HTH domain